MITCSSCTAYLLQTPKRKRWRKTYRAGGFGYGMVKGELAKASAEFFAEARQRRAELESSTDRVREILAEGGKVARAKAGEVLRRAQDACGVWVS